MENGAASTSGPLARQPFALPMKTRAMDRIAPPSNAELVGY
jgi:hypothetical protein